MAWCTSSRDNGKTWQNVTPKDMAKYTRVSIIEPGARTRRARRTSRRIATSSTTCSRTCGRRPTSAGRWTRIDAGIDTTEFTRAIREDDEKRGPAVRRHGARRVVLARTTARAGSGCSSTCRRCRCTTSRCKEGDLIAATHGRSFWIIDDLSPLRQLTPAVTASAAHLFKPRDAYRVSFAGRGFGGGGGASAGSAGRRCTRWRTSPAGGPVVNYWLKQAGREVTLEFLDAQGKLIRSFTSRQDSATAADSVRARRARARASTRCVAAGIRWTARERSCVARRAQAETDTGDDDDGPRRTPPPPRVPNKAGINSFAWNMRYPDASTFDGADHVGRRHPGPDGAAGHVPGAHDRWTASRSARRRSR